MTEIQDLQLHCLPASPVAHFIPSFPRPPSSSPLLTPPASPRSSFPGSAACFRLAFSCKPKLWLNKQRLNAFGRASSLRVSLRSAETYSARRQTRRRTHARTHTHTQAQPETCIRADMYKQMRDVSKHWGKYADASRDTNYWSMYTHLASAEDRALSNTQRRAGGTRRTSRSANCARQDKQPQSQSERRKHGNAACTSKKKRKKNKEIHRPPE